MGALLLRQIPMSNRTEIPCTTWLELLIPEEAILEKLGEIAGQLNSLYEGESLFIVAVHNGVVCLVADLLRRIGGSNEIEFIRCVQYGKRGNLRNSLKIYGLEGHSLEGRHVLIVDDIFGGGNRLINLLGHIQNMKPASVKTLVLLSKKVPREIPYQPNYVLFDIEDRFVVGYGLDYKMRFRGLKGVYALLLENIAFM
jgi:hypoxanthine phosphoribosyltransferase